MRVSVNNDCMEIASSCGCVQAFFFSPDFEIRGSTLLVRCGNSACKHDYALLLGVAFRTAACLQKAKPYLAEPTPAFVSACEIAEER